MLLSQLDYFVALARERHFGRAAAACHVSQSTLSEAVQKLELELGVRLVRRGHSFEGITAEGEQLLPWAQRMVADQVALRDAARSIGSRLSGTLRIGVVPTAGSSVARLVERFTAAHPLVRVRVMGGLPSEEITRRLRAFELDAGVLYPDPEPTPDLTSTLLYRERQRVLLSPTLAAGRTEIRADELSALPLVLLDERMRARRLLDDALATRGIALDPHLTVDSTDTLFALTGTGRWATVLPFPDAELVSDAELPSGLVALDLVEPHVVAPLVLAVLATDPAPATAAALVELARLFDR